MTNTAAQKNTIAVFIVCLIAATTHAQTDSLFAKDEVVSPSLTQRWELTKASRRGTFLITAYKPIYLSPGRWSNKPNYQPTSENPAYSLPFKVKYNYYEAKFQLSFKTKVWQGIFGTPADLWIAYTQKSHWQIYNQKLSRPFRETNYEPEVILNVPVNFSLLGFKGRMLGVAFNHQSNGRTLPLSRSWNRVIIHAAFERKQWTIYLRKWFRLKDEDDENPAICDYIGRAEAVVMYTMGKNMISLTGNHTLRLGAENRGRIEADWTFPVSGHLKGHVQVADGYGETLIDYNHSQATIGIGISLMEWL